MPFFSGNSRKIFENLLLIVGVSVIFMLIAYASFYSPSEIDQRATRYFSLDPSKTRTEKIFKPNISKTREYLKKLRQRKLYFTESPAEQNEDNEKIATDGEPLEELPFRKCNLPNFDPWDESLTRLISLHYNPMKGCNKNFRKLTSLINGTVETIDVENHECEARCLLREHDTMNKDTKFVSVESHTFNCDIVQTRCFNTLNGAEDYGMLHTQIVERKENHTTKSANGKQPDVYVILLDSVAHTQAIRNLPSTLSYFVESMGAIRFPYINKIGKNSRPNGIPLWFGNLSELIERTAYGMPNIEPDWSYDEYCSEYLDNKGFIMKEYQEYGYRTLLAEDWAYGTLNWPDCYGFEKQPTDHYMRPFQVELELSDSATLTSTYAQENCIEQHHDILRYLEQFMYSYEGVPKFGWVWLSLLTHDWQREVVHADIDFRDFLLNNRKKMDEAVVIIMGDHGLRFGEATSTDIGEEEINNPMFAISLPKHLRDSPIAEKLRENSKQLQTHFDIRATLLDILRYQPASNFNDTSLLNMTGEKYGSSLFRVQTPVERNCRTLPISFTYCICQFEYRNLTRNSSKALKIGNFVMNEINEMMEKRDYIHMCHPLQFDSFTKLTTYPPEELNGVYAVIAKAKSPSNAIYKVIVKRHMNGTYALATSSIDRLDAYGKRGDCVPYEVTHLCHCKDEYLHTAAPETTLPSSDLTEPPDTTVLANQNEYSAY